ncbi:hypothetical protein BDV95DRAFT_488700 [Massariosphaeria phaeospora]|uniref:F-box domain-containing protein n=1 Tax=Massariosphaeria phaeospora TaxID=100035 RepID=A0A7C8I8P6_9PLEO|nr:hypothetical protein BDV95DRAFT_488700 [Massariosphaeria phaeospora]
MSSTSTNDSRECSPVSVSASKAASEAEAKKSAFLKLPVDIFKCVTDYLDRDAAWSLKRLCRGMSHSQVVDELLYKYPIQLHDVREIRLQDWKYRALGQQRWQNFQGCINDSNRGYVQKLAMSHWCSVADFQWIEQNLPALTSLDISAIKDFVWTPEETWTWKQLADACPGLFGRLEELEVSNWADYAAHSRIEYSYSYNDYRFKQGFRLSRRRDGGSIANMIFPLCAQLKTLSIRDKYSGFHTWNEWEVHQRVCCLVDGIVKNCPATLSKLRVHDYAPYRSLFSTDATTWPNLTDVETGIYSWMVDRPDREVIGPIPYRITQGHHHRDEEEAFDDKTYDSCERDHMKLGSDVVQGVSASFQDLLLNLRTITRKFPKITFRPINTLKDMLLLPYHLVNVTQRRGFDLRLHQNQQQPVETVPKKEIREAVRWLTEQCDWKPILTWDTLMCDVFPANLESTRTFLPKADVMSGIKTMIELLRSLNIPIRLSIGDRSGTCSSSRLDGSLYFGDYKTFSGEGEDRQEMLAPTQARFNLTGIAHLVDELTIQYPVDVPGVTGWGRSSRRPTRGETILMEREYTGWRRFWTRYAHQFKNLKKLAVNVPSDIYNDWGKCGGLTTLLDDERWEMLESDKKDYGLHGLLGGYYPSANVRLHIARKRPRKKFVKRVFFRQDDAELNLALSHLELTDLEEKSEIPLDTIAHNSNLPAHRFWPSMQSKDGRGEKRKADEEEKALDPRADKKTKVD